MTDRELRRLSRRELLEMLLVVSAENERLREELEQTRQQLKDQKFEIEQAGSIAEAALRISHVFEAAQAAADRYLSSLRDTGGEGYHQPE